MGRIVLKKNDNANDFSWESQIEEADEVKKAQGNMPEVGFRIVMILAFIGIMNYTNTFVVNIQSRMTELSNAEDAFYGPKLDVNVRKILFDFLKNRKYNNCERVASKRKSSLPAARFYCITYRELATGNFSCILWYIEEAPVARPLILLKHNSCHEKSV